MSDKGVPAVVDLLIVGSGPVGATFARIVHERHPAASILMVDAGPQLTEQPGANIRNLPPPARRVAQTRSQGPDGAQRQVSPTGRIDGRIAARPGTFLLADPPDGDGDGQAGMPAAAMSSNVGGMSAHWTCACPAPGGSERNPFLDDKDFDEAFARACELLDVTTTAFRPTPVAAKVARVLHDVFDDGRAPGRVVQPMPLACRPQPGGLPNWSGSAQVLGPLAGPGDGEPGFVLAPATLCRRLLLEDGRVVSAELEHLPSGQRRTVAVTAVAVAADALRTPQLLWASGIRPAALGRYLNDQPQIMAAVVVDVDEPAQEAAAASSAAADVRDQLTGVLWIPFVDGTHPFHSQVMQLDASPIAVGSQTADPGGPVVGLGWFTTKELRAQDRVEFSSEQADVYGMPAMTIHYDLTAADRRTIAAATASLSSAAAALGRIAPGGEPRLMPAGSSMHYQGTVRMGDADDGRSVCDPSSRVWGVPNLFVGGNGVIPTPTACNPTATSVAMAVIAAEAVAGLLTE